MKIFLTSLIFSLSCIIVNAQQDRFIYLQTENKKPFFVKLNSKVFNSYPLGYLIIPKLNEGLYSLVIGFPETADEQEFNCSINKKDVGFIIKTAGDKQWQLLNVQTNTLIVPGDVITKPVIVYAKETDPFSIMLANAVHDSTILRKDVAKEILTEKPNDQIPKDTVNTLAANTDVAISKPGNTLQVDSTNKDIAKEILPEKSTELKQKDTTQIKSNREVAISKVENVIADSAKTDIAKIPVPEKTNELTPNDTTKTISNSDVVILKPYAVNDVTKQTLPEKSNELVLKDTAQKISTNDVAITKSKKKRAKKNDNALQDTTIAKTDIVKDIIPEKISETKDSAPSSNSNNDVAILRTTIKRKSKKNSKEGIEIIYVDDNGDTKDTIRILIPSDKKKKDDEVKITEPVVAVPTQQDGKPDYKITKQEKEIIKEANKEPVFIPTMINSDCKNFATNDDFLKVRKKIVAENNDEDMIKAARKYFKTKCFTTEQIKNLSVLFLKDEGKYMFFDAAYPFVSDSELYAGLEKQLSDDYYITRFRAMIHK